MKCPTGWVSTPTPALLKLALDASDPSGAHPLAPPAMAARKTPSQFQAEQPLPLDNQEIGPRQHRAGPKVAHGRETTLEWLLKTPLTTLPVEAHLLSLRRPVHPLMSMTDIPVNDQALLRLVGCLEAAAELLPLARSTSLILTLVRRPWQLTLPTLRRL
jgi:hypothetical protein